MNDENLIPQNQRTKSEQREIARKGGKASGEARRKRKRFRELLAVALEIEQTNSKGERKSLKEIGMVNLAAKVAKGDLKAIKLASDLLGETDNVENAVKLDLTINLV